MTDDLRQRFFSKIARGPGDCIDWVGARRPTGYGLISVDGKLHNATHVSWRLKHGDWPETQMLHRCDRPQCVNPEHLFEGTSLDNARDRDAKGRHNRIEKDQTPWAKLTGLEVSELVALTNTRMSLAEIGALYGVSAQYVSALRHGRCRQAGKPQRDKPKASKLYDVGGGEMLSVADIAKRSGTNPSTIDDRIKRGLSGPALLAGKHKAPRKQYVRRK